MKTKPTLLVIDDDSTVCRVVSGIAGKVYDITTASSRDGAATLLEKCFDILLMDGQMPGMNAEDFLACLRQKCPNTQVILMSGWFDATEAERLGIRHYLGKPFTSDELMKLLHRLTVGSGEQASIRMH